MSQHYLNRTKPELKHVTALTKLSKPTSRAAHFDSLILRAKIGGVASLASENALYPFLFFFSFLECDDNTLVFEEELSGDEREGEEQKAESCRAVGEAAGGCRLLLHVCMYICT